MTKENIGLVIGSVFAGLAVGATGGIFLGMKLRQKRADAEVESVKESFKKYFKNKIEDEKLENAKGEYQKPEVTVEETPEEVKEETKNLYDILPKKTVTEMMENEDVDVEIIAVDELGRSPYMSEDTVTSMVGLGAKDIAEALMTSDDPLYVRNNMTDVIYEVMLKNYDE